MTNPNVSNADAKLSATKRALRVIERLQAQIADMEREKFEPIAIVGMSCRLPGGVNTPETFWKLLQGKTDAISEVPDDRWSIDAYYDAEAETPGKMVSRYGGFVPHLYDFDASFFRVAPREALTLDPQQRLALELGWEALEQGGIAPEALADQQVGVFLGLSSIDHWQQMLARSPDTIDAYLATGNTHSVAAGRLSFLLGLTGPSMAVDTACSSSLVAVHLACQSLRQRECDMALVGGVNRIITPAASINFSKAQMLSADGRCRTFDAAATGFGRAEGGGMVVLKRLSDAELGCDRIHAIILGSATNHNGRTNGLTAPSKTAQQAVIRQALKASRITADQISYVETHGTGTALGDPIEVGALGDIFGNNPEPRQQPLVLGAVKTNIGHGEAAAGIAGLIKAVLALEHQQIPANLHLNSPNPHIDWQNLPFTLPTAAMPWLESPRIAGISAFGFNGTNAHVIVQEPPSMPHQAPSPSNSEPALLPLSARTGPTLNQLAARYAQHLAAHPTLALADVCFTASIGRNHFAHRLAIVANSITELRQILIAFLAGRPHPNYWQSHGVSDTNSEVKNDTVSDSLRSQAQQYIQGETVDWQSIYAANAHRKQVLPMYPFQREYYGLKP